MNFIAKNFVRGLAIVIPSVATAYVLYRTFLWIDRLIILPYPGLGVLVTLASIILLGAIASNYVGGKLLAIPDAMFTRAPLVKILYNSIKDLIEAFVGDRKRFNRPVLVRLAESPAIEALGFVTCDTLEFLGVRDRIAVYFPQSYNFAGSLVLVPTSSITSLDADSSRVMAFIVSGGVSGILPEPAAPPEPRV